MWYARLVKTNKSVSPAHFINFADRTVAPLKIFAPILLTTSWHPHHFTAMRQNLFDKYKKQVYSIYISFIWNIVLYYGTNIVCTKSGSTRKKQEGIYGEKVRNLWRINAQAFSSRTWGIHANAGVQRYFWRRGSQRGGIARKLRRKCVLRNRSAKKSHSRRRCARA